MQAAHSLRLVAVLNARNVRDDHAFSRANKAELEAPFRCFVLNRSIGRDIFGHFCKAFDSHCTFHALRAGDDADADAMGVPLTPALSPQTGRGKGRRTPPRPARARRGRGPRSGGVRACCHSAQLDPAAAPAVSSAALSRSCARAFGRDLTGVSPIGGFSMIPASPRKRATLSVGNAPTPSQCWIRSVLRVTRSACERSSIGL